MTVNNEEAKRFLMANGLDVVNRKVPIRSYDDVQAEDYSEFLSYMEYLKYIGIGKDDHKEKQGERDENEEGGEKTEGGEGTQEGGSGDKNSNDSSTNDSGSKPHKEVSKVSNRTPIRDANGNIETAVGNYDSDDSLA